VIGALGSDLVVAKLAGCGKQRFRLASREDFDDAFLLSFLGVLCASVVQLFF
jgi:hypothetical protein